jgi:hypothetical protein
MRASPTSHHDHGHPRRHRPPHQPLESIYSHSHDNVSLVLHCCHPEERRLTLRLLKIARRDIYYHHAFRRCAGALQNYVPKRVRLDAEDGAVNETGSDITYFGMLKRVHRIEVSRLDSS